MAKKKYKPLLSKAEKQVKRRKLLAKIQVIILLISMLLNVLLIKNIDVPILHKLINKNSDIPKISEQDVANKINIVNEKNADDTSEYPYFVQTTEDIDSAIIEQMSNHVYKMTMSNRINAIDDAVFSVELKKIISEHPEYFWTKGGGQWEIIKDTNTGMATRTFEFSLICDKDEVESMEKELELVVNTIVNEAESLDSDYEKVKYVHDYIVNNATYDYQGYEAIMNDGEVDELTGTAYGNLVNNTSVCEGYAEAFKLIMDRLNIECGVLSGIGTNELATGPHAWNYVKIDDEYYFVDVTWDDPVSDDGEQILSYDYFCTNYDQISKDHTFDSDQFVPECTSTKYMDILMEE